MNATHSTPKPNATQGERFYILGTSGHIDHGKTSLVRAMTGTDTDRLPEERRRGMTIELGFAVLRVGDAQFGIVDVPGHERFVRTMVAGATGIDLALLVVAADDSVMPQTIEHVEILQLLGVHHGVVAVTKIDTVDSELTELVVDDVKRLLTGTPLESAPICPVSSVTGRGVEEVKRALEAVSRAVQPKPAKPPFRMALDRVFTVQGRGTVVTGSVIRGLVREGETLEVWPSGETCRVRGLQSHGAASDSLSRGRRAAVNLSGIERDHVQRGCELATPGYLHSSRMLDVQLHCLASSARPLKSTAIVRLEVGTSEQPVRAVLVDRPVLQPGEWAFAQLRCGEPVVAAYGQRFIIRNENATRTIGGGIVLRSVARRRRREVASELECLQRLLAGSPAERLEEVLRHTGFRTPTELELCAFAGVEIEEIPDLLARLEREGRWVAITGTDFRAAPAAIDDLADRLSKWLDRYHSSHPEWPGRPVDSVLGWLERMVSKAAARPLFEKFLREGVFKRLGRFVCLPTHAPSLSPADEKLLASMLEGIRAGEFQPPALEELPDLAGIDRKRRERLATLAVALGDLRRIDQKILLHAETEEALRRKVIELIEREGPVTVAQIKEALNSSRKYVVPFVEYLDRIGVTARRGDHRVLADDVREKV